jgi:hypothetical protein
VQDKERLIAEDAQWLASETHRTEKQKRQARETFVANLAHIDAHLEAIERQKEQLEREHQVCAVRVVMLWYNAEP